ncbi:MAG: DUF6351 family protein, partial [Actinomycetota bacterium]
MNVVRRRARLPRVLCLLAVVALLASVFGVAGSAGRTSPAIKVLSNRADLISGGDALVEVVVPERFQSALGKPAAVLATLWDATLNDADITKSFSAVRGALSTAGKPHLLGMVKGLKAGKNLLSVRMPDGSGARITITNHSIGGPIFGGPQVLPWVCATEDNGL